MTAAQASERLVKVRAAIDAILDGVNQSVSIGGRAYTRLELSELRKMEADLERTVARLSGGGSAAVVKFHGAAS
ncbi:MAG TPA: hypothetical protein VFH53_02585 [Phycisphaerae bacterium]|nr:hypothetical protein [Phycisphaerae bacterium]